MEWDQKLFPDKPEHELCFDENAALALLLMNDVLFANNWYYRKESMPNNVRNATRLFVNWSDIFAWAYADGQSLPFSEIRNLYEMWQKDPIYGPAVWCMQRRNQMPQPEVEKIICEMGIWNLTTMGLRANSLGPICPVD